MGISVAPYGPPLVSTKNRSKPWKPPVTHSSTATHRGAADHGHLDAPEQRPFTRAVEPRRLDHLGRDLPERGVEDDHVEARVHPAGHDADGQQCGGGVAQPDALEAFEPDGGEGTVEQSEVGVVHERPEHRDDHHRQHHGREDGHPEPEPTAAHAHEAREPESDHHLQDQGRGDVDEHVHERAPEHRVVQGSDVVVEAHERHRPEAVPVEEAVAAGQDHRQQHREAEHGEAGREEQPRRDAAVRLHRARGRRTGRHGQPPDRSS